MNKKLLIKHLEEFKKNDNDNALIEREEISLKYAQYTKEKINNMTEQDLFEYLAPLWAMLIWGNKQYYINQIITDNGLDNIKQNLINLLWSKEDIEKRWDSFKENIKGLGPAMMSELLCRTHPHKYLIWNRRALVALNYLEIKNLPVYNYQMTGEKYKELCNVAISISDEMKKMNFSDYSLLAVDYFFWDQLQVEDNLNAMSLKESKEIPNNKKTDKENNTDIRTSIHNEIRDKIAEIGIFLGFTTKTEEVIGAGARIDTLWQISVGNMGRIIYAFEVQTKGSIDSLCMNLLKAKNNPSVQAIIAVSDKEQIEKIKKEAKNVPGLENIKYWDYESVLDVHRNLEKANETINALALVPKDFNSKI